MENPTSSPPDSQGQSTDLHRLIELLRNPETNGLGKAVQQHILHEQFDYQNRILKWGFGIIAALVAGGITVAVNDHFALKSLSESVTENRKKIDSIQRRNEVMWYDGSFHTKYPNIQQPNQNP